LTDFNQWRVVGRQVEVVSVNQSRMMKCHWDPQTGGRAVLSR